MIERSEWKYYGHAGHLIISQWCRFHLCTEIGPWVVSTVGEYVPDEGVREIMANSQKITLEGRGDNRLADFMNRVGFVEIGYKRTYETMVFKVNGHCQAKDCNCGLPIIEPSELDSNGYNDPKAATEGHYELCEKWAIITEEAHAGTRNED